MNGNSYPNYKILINKYFWLYFGHAIFVLNISPSKGRFPQWRDISHEKYVPFYISNSKF